MLRLKVLLAPVLLVGGLAVAAPRRVVSLDGVWQLATDAGNVGKKERWFAGGPPTAARPARVPAALEETFPGYDGVVWYWRRFRLPESPRRGQRVLVRFWAADYFAEVWLNGKPIGRHEGGETPFALDATAAARPRAENRLVVRLINPKNEDIDGFHLKHVPHGIKVVDFSPGTGRFHNYGGLWQSVELEYVPEVRVLDLFAEPRLDHGEVIAHVTLLNQGAQAARGGVEIAICPAASGGWVASHRQTVELPLGESRLDVPIQVASPRPWSLDDPFLYSMTASLSVAGKLTDRLAVRFGFREFTFRHGYFRLNGKRLILKSAHTVGHYPIGLCRPPDRQMLRRELLLMKRMGFNCIRSLGRLMFPEQLAFCDELGLMVYEETEASWLWHDSPKMAERFDAHVREGIVRDRNHPSVVIWGLLNEMGNTPIFRHAVAMLPLVRKHDPTRLVVLNSGRWDDQQGKVGNLCLPYTSQWTGGIADVHAYPPAPVDFRVLAAYRAQPPWPKNVAVPGGYKQPASANDRLFQSEYGNGSAIDPVRACRLFERHGARPDLEDFRLYRAMAERFEADWRRLKLDAAFPTPSDLVRASEEVQAENRRIGLNALRANPKLCGISLTGLTDSCMAGEGLTTIWREPKKATLETLRKALAPLHWSVFVNTTSIYSGQAIRAEALLINEDVLPPGQYPARLEVAGPGGIVWSKARNVTVPSISAGQSEIPTMVHPAFKEAITVEGPPGRYEVIARLERGGDAMARSPFYVSDPAALPKCRAQVTVADYGKKLSAWLAARGVKVSQFAPAKAAREREVILVATAGIYPRNLAAYQELMSRVARGSAVVFLMPKVFRAGKKGRLALLPLPAKGRFTGGRALWWSIDHFVKAHPIFDGMPSNRLMDPCYYRLVWPSETLVGASEGETVAGAFGIGCIGHGGYWSGADVAVHPFGKGRMILNTLLVVENLGRDPAADRLLLNLVTFAAAKARGPLAKPSPNWQRRWHKLLPGIYPEK